MNGFYLHFRSSPPQSVLDALISAGCTLDPVFETSFDLLSPLSMSEMKFLLKSFPDVEYVLVKEKGIFTHAFA